MSQDDLLEVGLGFDSPNRLHFIVRSNSEY